ncbi:MAG: isoleucyl-tRNA synthetase [Parcubacteria group bacterium Gr01-1014_33]|nr:MAG: isoleucyl-tRNA synthetase [Parcubacteria group bacterium Gr01-1014_33]
MKAHTLEGRQALRALQEALLGLSRLTAPITPFLAEMIFKEVSDKKIVSVHLEPWPSVNKGAIKKELEEDMERIRRIASHALRLRAEAGIRVRQPLAELRITNTELRKKSQLLNLIKEEINVKKITFGKEMRLDMNITTELKEEGIIRELIRNIQEMRRELGLTPKDIIMLAIEADNALQILLGRWEKKLLKDVRARSIHFGKDATKTNREISFEEGSARVGIA